MNHKMMHATSVSGTQDQHGEGRTGINQDAPPVLTSFMGIFAVRPNTQHWERLPLIMTEESAQLRRLAGSQNACAPVPA